MIDYIKMYENMSVSKEVSSLNFPLYFHFKLLSIANDFFVRDEAGNEIAYTRQKMFKLKESIQVFPNRDQNTPVLRFRRTGLLILVRPMSFRMLPVRFWGKWYMKGLSRFGAPAIR